MQWRRPLIKFLILPAKHMLPRSWPVHARRGPPEADELLARAGFVQNTDYKWPHGKHGAAAAAASPSGGGGGGANGARL